MNLSKNAKGFAAIEAVLIVIVLGIIGFTGWFVYHSQKTTDKILTQADTASVQTDADKPTIKSAEGSQKYLVIKEWGVKFPITNDQAELTYTPLSSESSTEHVDGYEILSPTIAAQCGTGWNGDVSRVVRIGVNDPNTALVDAYKKNLGSTTVQIGNYYYGISGLQNTCNDTAGPKALAIASSLASEFKHLVKE